MKSFLIILFTLSIAFAKAQTKPDNIYSNTIHTPMLYVSGNQTGYPIVNLGATNALQLDFDDFDSYIKSYNYTYTLCNADWTEVDLSPFDYLTGFTQQRITQYRQSSVATTKYVHYQAQLPAKDCMPKLSGNYLLKVFLNGDQNKLAFTKRIMVVNSKVSIGAQILQPFDNERLRTHQKVQFTVDKTQLSVIDPRQQLKVVVLQNYRWDNAIKDIYPAFIRGNALEYNGELDCLFPAGREYRWIDMRSFRFKSDRMSSNDLTTRPFTVGIVPDAPRVSQRYIFYRDLNGFYEISATDVDNAMWQGDYANVHFTFVPTGNIPYPNKDVLLLGKFMENKPQDSAKLTYNADKGIYETDVLLKQGYYTYSYATKDLKTKKAVPVTEQTDGNYWETENDYTILVYYRSFTGRHDELVGVTSVNSRMGRLGF
jgi:Domain of unknown function (DUF5103)